MAYFTTPEDEEAQRQQAAQPLATAAPAPAAPATAAAPTPGTQAPQPGGQKGSGFVNLQDYLGANKGAAQGMADTLYGGVEKDAAALDSSAQAGASAFQKRIYEGVPQRPGEVRTSAEARAESQRGYGGPTDWDTTGMRSRLDAGTKRAGLLGTDAGRGVVLQDTYGKGNPYGTGARGLDSFLLGAAGGARAPAAQQRFGQLRDYLGLHEARLEGNAAQQAANVQQTQAHYGRTADSLAADEARGLAGDQRHVGVSPEVARLEEERRTKKEQGPGYMDDTGWRPYDGAYLDETGWHYPNAGYGNAGQGG